MPSKWLRDHRKQDLRDHKKRIENMKSTIDTAPPRELPMSKRNEMERARKQALVEQDNRLLLDRLAIAMSTKNIDNVLIEKPFISLMELQRKKQLKKMMIQNSRLLDRIQCTVPSYDHVLWEREAEHHVEILRNMTEFPDLFVAPGCHKKGYDMAVVDAERAQQKLIATKGVERSNSASPTHQRDNNTNSNSNARHSGEKNNKNMRQSKSGVNVSGEGSPHSQQSKGSGYVPYSYFPEEQYAQYQMQLQMQMQLQAQQQQMQMQQGQGQYQQQHNQQYQQQQQYNQQQYQQQQQYTPQYTPQYAPQYAQQPSEQQYGTNVPLAPALTPEQQYAHQQQLYLYHQQQQQRMNYNNTTNNTNNTTSNTNANSSQPYYYSNSSNTNYTPQLAPMQTNTTNAGQQYVQYNNSAQQGVQLPNIYEHPPGHMGQPPY